MAMDVFSEFWTIVENPVCEKCGITEQMLFGQPPFLVVFKEMML